MDIDIVREKINKERVLDLANQSFGDMVKIVVDLERKILAIGGELHADAEAVLLADGSVQKDIWGANIYIDRSPGERLEYTSLINIRPAQGNKTIAIQDPLIQEKVRRIVELRVQL